VVTFTSCNIKDGLVSQIIYIFCNAPPVNNYKYWFVKNKITCFLFVEFIYLFIFYKKIHLIIILTIYILSNPFIYNHN
jgi:hypothetical protein